MAFANASTRKSCHSMLSSSIFSRVIVKAWATSSASRIWRDKDINTGISMAGKTNAHPEAVERDIDPRDGEVEGRHRAFPDACEVCWEMCDGA